MKDPILLAFLTLLWVGLTGVDPANVGLGLAVAWLILLWAPDVPSHVRGPASRRLARAARSLPPLLALVGVFLVELVQSSLRVAREVLRPTLRVRPAVLHIPLDARTDTELTVLAALLSLTPGVLCIDVAEDGEGIYVHVMQVTPDDLDATRRRIRDGFWPYVVRALRADAQPPRPAPGAPRPGVA